MGSVSGVRIGYLLVYAALAALGEALVARPALLWLRGQGLLHAALPWQVPLGGLAFACAALVALFTLFLAARAALGKKPRVPMHAAFLGLLVVCFAVRSWGGDARPPRDPKPVLLEGLRAAAAALDRDYRGAYDAAAASSAPLPAPGYRRLGRALPMRVRAVSGEGPQLEPLPGDAPGTIYVAISGDRKAAWLTALGLSDVVKLASGKPALVELHEGTHSLPGRDPVVPAYPGMRSSAK